MKSAIWITLCHWARSIIKLWENKKEVNQIQQIKKWINYHSDMTNLKLNLVFLPLKYWFRHHHQSPFNWNLVRKMRAYQLQFTPQKIKDLNWNFYTKSTFSVILSSLLFHGKKLEKKNTCHKQGKQTYRQTQQTKDSKISGCSLGTRTSSLNVLSSILWKIGNRGRRLRNRESGQCSTKLLEHYNREIRI